MRKLAPGTTTIFHNSKFDCHFLRVVPDEQGWNLVDTTVLIHLIDSRYKKKLEVAEATFLGESSKRGYVDAAPARTKIWLWPKDLRACYQLAEELIPQVNDLFLWKLFVKDMRYISTLMRIENYGVLSDQDFMRRSNEALKLRLEILSQQLYESVGHDFNWRSTKQLSQALYHDMGIAKPKNPFADADGVDRSRFADSGKYKSTCTSSFLLTEKVHHPLGELVSALRETNQMMSFIKKWTELTQTDEIFHTNFNITGTRTGRLSSSKPNLQNVPSEVRGRFTQSVFSGDTSRTDEYNLRKAFVARPGRVFLSVDYKQMELRMTGIICQDPNMIKLLVGGKDVHLETAINVWGDCGEEMNKIHREWSKTISFGLVYGMTLGSLMYKLNMDRPRAAEVINQYKAEFPRLDPWMLETIEQCKSYGYLRYWSGRLWREENVIDMYKGCNAMIQGGCADMLSIAAIRVDDWCKQQGSEYNIVNLVHDEIIVEVPEEDVERCATEVAEIMQLKGLFVVPFATDPKWGASYGDLNKKGIDADAYAEQRQLQLADGMDEEDNE
jgi:DNA polymerase-1